MPLLLEADPLPESVLPYLQTGECFVATESGKILGAYVLQRTQPFTDEILNVVVKKEYRKLGIGKMLFNHALEAARQLKARRLEIAIGNSHLSALAFYQRSGFRMQSIEPDYFTRFYPDRVVENGIERRDLVRLRLNL